MITGENKKMYDTDNDIWEDLELESGTYTKGDPMPNHNFDFYIRGLSEKNVYCSNDGIHRQILETLERNPNREKVIYFYYKRINQ